MQFTIDFSHIHARHMTALKYESMFDIQPWQNLDLSLLDGLHIHTNLQELAKNKFYELALGEIDDFDIIDVLALSVIKNKDWQDASIHPIVTANWWQSALNNTNHRALRASLVLVLQYHKNIEVYEKFANTDALYHLKHALNSCQKKSWHDDILRQLVISILSERPSQLADLALSEYTTVVQLINQYNLPISSKLKEAATITWLTSYLKLSERQLPKHSKAIHQFLNRKSDIHFAVAQAEAIFSNRYFKQDLNTLEKQTQKFTDIYSWLKVWNKDPEFQKLLDKRYRSIIRCWLGAGNYYQLEKAVRFIAQMNNENLAENRSISVNRYIFWTNYQQHIVDYWLLIPESQKSKYQPLFTTTNVRFIRNYDNLGYFSSIVTKNLSSTPTVLLKFDNYYVVQPLINTAGGRDSADLIMIDTVNVLDNLLEHETIESHRFNFLKPCFIHDHMFLWQRDMALCLKERFNINVGDANNFVCTPTFTDNLNKSKFSIKHQERLDKIEDWYQSSSFRVDLEKYAISYQKRRLRHG